MVTGNLRWLAVAAISLAAGCDGPDLSADEQRREGAAPSTSTVVHLASGDSVEVVAVGPAYVPNQAPGVLFTYHPFLPSLDDTARLVPIAKDVWRTTVRPQLGDRLPPFVVLQATSRRAGPIRGTFNESTFGVVLERRPDGKWYRLNTGEAVE